MLELQFACGCRRANPVMPVLLLEGGGETHEPHKSGNKFCVIGLDGLVKPKLSRAVPTMNKILFVLDEFGDYVCSTAFCSGPCLL